MEKIDIESYCKETRNITILDLALKINELIDHLTPQPVEECTCKLFSHYDNATWHCNKCGTMNSDKHDSLPPKVE